MSTLQRICQFCKKPILGTGVKFCSPECVVESLKSEPKECKNCGAKFRPAHKSAQFCSLKCFNEDRVKKSRQTPEPPPIPGARWLPLTQRMFALVDMSDFEDLNRYIWCAVKVRPNHRGEVYYAKRTDLPVYLHRYLMNPSDTEEVDHFNGNTLDCMRSNLILVDKSGNQANRLVSSGAASGFKGVNAAQKGKWVVRLCRRGSNKCLGTYSDPVEAAKIYDKAVRAYREPNATYNFPEIGERSAITGKVRES